MPIPKKRRAELAHLTRDVFVQRWPNVFAARGQNKRPLKVSIAEDIHIAMPELNFAAIRAALADYTWGTTYCQNVVEGAERIDLDGRPCGKVTAAEAAHAADRLAMFERQKQEALARQNEGAAA